MLSPRRGPRACGRLTAATRPRECRGRPSAGQGSTLAAIAQLSCRYDAITHPHRAYLLPVVLRATTCPRRARRSRSRGTSARGADPAEDDVAGRGRRARPGSSIAPAGAAPGVRAAAHAARPGGGRGTEAVPLHAAGPRPRRCPRAGCCGAGVAAADELTDAMGSAALGRRAAPDGLTRAAAAIADGHAAAEREIATRSASALRELPRRAARPRRRRRAAAARASRGGPASWGSPVDGRSPSSWRMPAATSRTRTRPSCGVARRARAGHRARPSGSTGARRADPRAGRRGDARAARRARAGHAPRPGRGRRAGCALGDAGSRRPRPPTGCSAASHAAREATAALAVARRIGRPGGSCRRGRSAGAGAPRRPALLRGAPSTRELGPLLRVAGDGAGLSTTLEACLASGENVRAAARPLDIAPRTVAYRLARIEGSSAPGSTPTAGCGSRRRCSRDASSDDAGPAPRPVTTRRAAAARPR